MTTIEKSELNLYIDFRTYVDPSFVETSNFLIGEVPIYHPLSVDYREFWSEQRRRCIEGCWVSGVWMPGKLYFYINFNTIKRNVKGANVKSWARPLLRDVEWMVFYNLEEARGFSGFADDSIYSTHEALLEDRTDEQIVAFHCWEEGEFSQARYDNIFQSSGARKIYVPTRDYIRQVHGGNLGRALYYNNAKNMLTFGSREFGKSYMGGNIILHEWLFDGLTEYKPGNRVDSASEVLMGAFDAKYSGETLSKVKIGLEKLPGQYESYEKKYPAPFAKKYTGSWGPSKDVTAEYKKKLKGNWDNVGTKSVIKHRTFKDNPFAGQGTRPGIIMAEEIGMWPNFIECYGALVDNQREGTRKFGSMLMFGTGGNFDGGGAAGAYDIFYDPRKYDCLAFDDIWEGKGEGGEICFFMPTYLALNDTKDGNGKTDLRLALSKIHDMRTKLGSNKGSKDLLNKEVQNRPVKPSEMFLSRSGNYFPTIELKERLNLLEGNPNHSTLEKRVRLYFDGKEKYGVKFQIDTTNELTALNNYPWKGPSKEGCVVIYEFPLYDRLGNVPEGLYLIGHDPIATDSVSGESYAATYVIKTRKYWNQAFGHDEIVAVYITRPYDGRAEINENLLKLSMLYGNAKIYFENAVGNVKEYFEKVKRLDLLAKQPTTLFNKKASYENGTPVVYGYPMSNRKIKLDGVQYLRDWLMEVRGQDDESKTVRNLDRIHDKALLQELIAFDLDGNFDRVMGLMGAIIGLYETHNQYENSIKKAAVNDSVNEFSILQFNRLFNSNTVQLKEDLRSDSFDLSMLNIR